jgi:S1-C subfamily serine protease|tara:strand:+ start:367 stop:816 length:450 start_codon:yes stop_codon:yes gene_type:complete
LPLVAHAGDSGNFCQRYGTAICARFALPDYLGPWIPAGRRLTYASGRPAEGETADIAALGLSVSEITTALATRHRISQAITGLVVTALEPFGIAAREGLEMGDVLMEIDQQPIGAPSALVNLLVEVATDNALLLVYRDYAEVFTVVTLR